MTTKAYKNFSQFPWVMVILKCVCEVQNRTRGEEKQGIVGNKTLFKLSTNIKGNKIVFLNDYYLHVGTCFIPQLYFKRKIRDSK